MKQEFLNFLNALMEAAPDVVERLSTDNIMAYIAALNEKEEEKPEMTDNGKLIVDFLQKSTDTVMKARDIAEGLFISSRIVSGAMRKLVNDGFCEKMGQNPVLYALTEKGKNYKIDN